MVEMQWTLADTMMMLLRSCQEWSVIKHRAKRKTCRFEGCQRQIVKDGVCVTHGARVKRCCAEGCQNQAIKGGVCIRHGAKR